MKNKIISGFVLVTAVFYGFAVYSQAAGLNFDKGSGKTKELVGKIKSSSVKNIPKPKQGKIELHKVHAKEISPMSPRVICEEFGLPLMTVTISRENVQRQTNELANKVSFEEALRKGLKSFLEDYSDEESPLGLMLNDAFDETGTQWVDPVPEKVLQLAREKLFHWMNSKGAVLSLLEINEIAEHNETVKENWILRLTMEEYSDHMYWAVVDRQGKNPTFNYGFN